jgi:hypothetical protein
VGSTLDIEAYATFLSAQNLAKKVFTRYAPMLAPKPCIIVSRSGGDRNDTFEANDGSLVSTTVKHQVLGAKPSDADPIADQLLGFLEGCWPVTAGSRTIVGIQCEEPTDVADPPQDGSDNWLNAVEFDVTILHSA